MPFPVALPMSLGTAAPALVPRQRQPLPPASSTGGAAESGGDLAD